jgi:hypothetical protein
MKDVNLTNIYLHMVRFYGVKRFEVFSDIDQKWLNPKETLIEFYFDTSKKSIIRDCKGFLNEILKM